MGVHVQVPITTAVIEQNEGCVVRGEFRDGAVVIEIDTRRMNHHAILGLTSRTTIHWPKKPRTYDVQELSCLPWAIRYQVTTRDGYYRGPDGQRVHYTPAIKGP